MILQVFGIFTLIAIVRVALALVVKFRTLVIVGAFTDKPLILMAEKEVDEIDARAYGVTEAHITEGGMDRGQCVDTFCQAVRGQ